jgi:excinuclease UvrABC nuclease subunit
MSTKKVRYSTKGIGQLPNAKPVLYRIKAESGDLNYVGSAKRGRVKERILEHLGKIPGATVQIEQFSSIADAQQKEANVIKKTQPKYNKQGK